MNNNCLVTKLKGTVQNDNLPEYKTIYLNLFGTDRRSDDPNVSYILLLAVKQGKSVTLSSLYPFHSNDVSAPSEREHIVSSTTPQAFVFSVSEIPSTAVENAIKITGDIYDLTSCSTYSPGQNVGAAIDFTTKTTKNSIDSLNYAESLISTVGCPDSIVPDSVEVLSIQDWPVSGTKDYSSIVSENNNIKYLTSEKREGGIYQIILTSSLTKYHNLKYLMTRASGSILSLPLSIISLEAASSVATGSLEDFVANRRNNGKTTGYLAISNPGVTWNITYNGTPIKDLSTSVRPIIKGHSFLCWDATNIWWASETPEGFTIYTTPFWATKAALDGTL